MKYNVTYLSNEQHYNRTFALRIINDINLVNVLFEDYDLETEYLCSPEIKTWIFFKLMCLMIRSNLPKKEIIDPTIKDANRKIFTNYLDDWTLEKIQDHSHIYKKLNV